MISNVPKRVSFDTLFEILPKGGTAHPVVPPFSFPILARKRAGNYNEPVGQAVIADISKICSFAQARGSEVSFC
ncbi:MAG: hypothetical protein IIZ25_00315, partial [Thermoguttaceae bacterium]|nr:hypothetical protein [Thermoguttaceae bacterium]